MPFGPHTHTNSRSPSFLSFLEGLATFSVRIHASPLAQRGVWFLSDRCFVRCFDSTAVFVVLRPHAVPPSHRLSHFDLSDPRSVIYTSQGSLQLTLLMILYSLSHIDSPRGYGEMLMHIPFGRLSHSGNQAYYLKVHSVSLHMDDFKISFESDMVVRFPRRHTYIYVGFQIVTFFW